MNGLPVRKSPTFNEQEMEIPAGRNAVYVTVAGQSFVSLSQNDVEIVRSQTTEPVVPIVAEPGRYVLRSDGQIGSVTFQIIALPPAPFKTPGELFGFALSFDAKDQHIVDGVGEIKADGRSSCVISAQSGARRPTDDWQEGH